MNSEQHLSRISTLWTLVQQAHAGNPDEVGQAQRILLQRYSGAVHRYLLGALRDPDAADELFQDFCLRFLRGAFRNADPGRGRFRDFVKTAVFHLIVDYQKQRLKQPAALPSALEPAIPTSDEQVEEQTFLTCWREELLTRTWQALQEFERQTAQPHHTILRFRTDHPLLSSEELADQVGSLLGKTFTVVAIRQALHRAREKFADLLLQEVEESLEPRERSHLEEELADLKLLAHCRAALERRNRFVG